MMSFQLLSFSLSLVTCYCLFVTFFFVKPDCKNPKDKSRCPCADIMVYLSSPREILPIDKKHVITRKYSQAKGKTTEPPRLPGHQGQRRSQCNKDNTHKGQCYPPVEFKLYQKGIRAVFIN